MKIEQFPEHIRPYLIPEPTGRMVYYCLDCKGEFGIDRMLYTCPDCKGLLLLHDKNFGHLKEIGGERWREIFDYRRMLNHRSLKGIFLYYEFIA
ncbi:MAG: threonine synthase, partial [Deltaproteobacteria bacterium]|nr:threonine synthase [Deltaproteobacteria bacterium]